MIGLDWIGFLEREKEKRDGTQVNEGEQHERTNERRHFSAFVSWSFLRRQRPESVDQKQRTESRTFPNFTTRDTKERRFCARRKTRKDTRIRAYACVYAHTHTHTHTHTQRERFAHHVVSFLLFLRASCVKNNVRGSIPNYCMNFEYTIYHNLLIKLKTLLLLLLLLLL